jgi:hypothetical protein
VLGLKLVVLSSGADNPLDLAFAAEAAFREAIKRLGNGPYGQATRLLFGVDSESVGLPLKTRRRLAAEELDVYPSTFRRLYEDGILGDLTFELLRQESACQSRSPQGDARP